MRSIDVSKRLVALGLVAVGAASSGSAALAGPPSRPPAGAPDFGPNVRIFSPEMSRAQIQAVVDGIASQQVPNEFGSERYALLFKPGAYGSAMDPLNFQVGYYTQVAGLGRSPTEIVINGSINVYNQCRNGSCTALNNFWRSLSNLTIDVNNASLGCYAGEFWAVSQAAPMRRVRVNGTTTLMDYCTGPSFASGGFIADSEFNVGTVINGSQQQWMVRNSKLTGWTNGVWNQVFSGVEGAPAPCFPAQAGCGPYTTLATSPVTREAPMLYVDAAGQYQVFVPALRRDSSGTAWSSGAEAGTSIPISQFFIARPSDDARAINRALASGKHLIFTPGIYSIDRTIRVHRAGTVVMGLGLATLVPQRGVIAMAVADVRGVNLSGLVFDAGPVTSPVLLRIGGGHGSRRGTRDDARFDGEDDGGSVVEDARGAERASLCGPRGSSNHPIALQDVFFRIGGAAAGKATVSLEINSDHVLLDNTWAWRADHGNGVGWTVNPADTGVVVNGDHVTAYGLFVEHYQKYEVIWNGNDGNVVFFQNELPYDVPSQAAWTSAPGVKGWAALKIADSVTSFRGAAMGSYSFFNQGLDIYASHAFEVPTTLPAGSLRNLLTIFLDPGTGRGGIDHVINDTGGSSTIANPDVPVTVLSYP
jgi:Pectate lyase superfamily protein